MPYNNSYNREIKKDLNHNIMKMIDNEQKEKELFVPTFYSQFGDASKQFEGSGVPSYLNDGIKFNIDSAGNVLYGDASQFGSRVGGSGFGAASQQDTGYDKTMGAIGSGKMGKGAKVYKKETLKLDRDVKEGGAKRKRGRPSKKMLEGGNWLSDFGKGFMSVVSPVLSIAKPILKTIPSPYTQAAGGVLDAIGAGKKRGRPRKVVEGGAVLGMPKTKKGGAVLGLPKSLVGGNMIGESVKRVVGGNMIGESVKRVVGGKKTNKNEEGGNWFSHIADKFTGGKRGRPSKMSAGRKLTPVANMQASQMTAGAKPNKVNKRAELVKKIMKEQNLSMIKASSYVKAHNLYKKE